MFLIKHTQARFKFGGVILQKAPNKKIASENTPTPKDSWLTLSEEGRLALVNAEVEKKYQEFIDVIGANENGYITIQLKARLSTRERGGLLLDLEQSLKEAVDESLTVWLEPQADKSKLRKLRGVIVKS